MERLYSKWFDDINTVSLPDELGPPQPQIKKPGYLHYAMHVEATEIDKWSTLVEPFVENMESHDPLRIDPGAKMPCYYVCIFVLFT